MSDNSFELAKKAFVDAIVFCEMGLKSKARTCAEECLRLLQNKETMSETDAGQVSSHVGLPDFLHVDTARQRFKQAGIPGF